MKPELAASLQLEFAHGNRIYSLFHQNLGVAFF